MALETKPSSNGQKLGTNRWSSESRLHSHSADVVSRNCAGDFNHKEKSLSNKGRLSFGDLLLRRAPSEQGGLHQDGSKSSKSGILDSLKRRFKIARSEHSRLLHMNKRHSFSLSISSIVEESTCSDSLPKSKTLPAVQQEPTCRLCSMPVSRNARGNCCDIHSELDPLSEQQDDQNNQSPPVQVIKDIPSITMTFFYLTFHLAGIHK